MTLVITYQQWQANRIKTLMSQPDLRKTIGKSRTETSNEAAKKAKNFSRAGLLLPQQQRIWTQHMPSSPLLRFRLMPCRLSVPLC